MPRSKAASLVSFTVPGLDLDAASTVADMLQDRLNALTDLSLTLKHIHWNVVGPHFIAVHTMLDPQVEAVRAMADVTAERIATLGRSPVGTPGALVKARAGEDYSLGRADAISHLGALDLVYAQVIAEHRQAIDKLEDLDLVTQDLVIEQTEQLERFQWFVRAHVESSIGVLTTEGARTERGAAAKAAHDSD
ncbi:MAG TPA: DNA starvation/stationary phase protection protein [Jiangellales bacterium]|nr:DNA starvation/stationary phase protection protein [Jiangellales bacterium]